MHSITRCETCLICGYGTVPSVLCTGDANNRLQVSVSGGVHNDLIKRVMRDIHRTGQEAHQAIQQIMETVYPMFKVSHVLDSSPG